jgi:hypothetical protein
MAFSAELYFDIIAAALCTALILTRCAYRLFFRCRVHPNCHRQWRIDDAFMAFALLPLVGRTTTIVTSFILDPNQSLAPPTAAEASAAGLSLDAFTADRIASRKLIIPARICYALLYGVLPSCLPSAWTLTLRCFSLWSLKLCLLSFYSRLMDALERGHAIVRALRALIIITFVAVLIATLTECRPLSIMWHLAPKAQRDMCTRGLANLMTMAIFNIVTDLALIVLPFPILKFIRLDRRAKIQLSFLFGIGLVVVIVTVLRIPLILVAAVSQRSRSMWASIEILCACIVANAAFFLAIVKDLQGQHNKPSYNAPSAMLPDSLYLSRLPSSLEQVSDVESAQARACHGSLSTYDSREKESRASEHS